MKDVIFALASLLGVPVVALVWLRYPKLRPWLVTLLVLSTAFGDPTGINFVSREHYRGPDRGFEVTLTDLVAWGIGVGLVLRSPWRLRFLPYNFGWMLLLFAAAALSTLLAPSPLYGSFTLFKLMRMGIVYWCLVNALRVGVAPAAIWRGFIGVGLWVLVLTLEQKYGAGLYRTHGPFDHSNTVPLYLNLVLPALLLRTLAEPRLSRFEVTLGIVAVLGMLFSIYATFSRGGIVLAALIVTAALTLEGLRTRSRRTRVIAGVMISMLAVAGLRAAPRVVERFREAPLESGEARVEFNTAAAMMSRDHLLGVGLNNFSKVLTDSERYHRVLHVTAEEDPAGVCHHVYWLTLAEIGPFGLALFLIVIGRFVWRALARGWQIGGPRGMALWGFALGHLALHASGLLEWAFRITPVMALYVITAAALVAWSEPSRAVGHAARSQRPTPIEAEP